MRKKLSESELEVLIESVISDLNTSKITSKMLNIDSIDFGKIEHYDATVENCWSFRNKGDFREGIMLNLGNMVSGYSFNCLGNYMFQDSECAYIAGCYSDEGEQYVHIQNSLKDFKGGGYHAKGHFRKSNDPVIKLIRKDWETFNIHWMLTVVWQKVINNAEFRNVLLSIPHDAIIIENSTGFYSRTSAVWGAKNEDITKLRQEREKRLVELMTSKGKISKKDIEYYCQILRNRINNYGVWTGQNAMGKILS